MKYAITLILKHLLNSLISIVSSIDHVMYSDTAPTPSEVISVLAEKVTPETGKNVLTSTSVKTPSWLHYVLIMLNVAIYQLISSANVTKVLKGTERKNAEVRKWPN